MRDLVFLVRVDIFLSGPGPGTILSSYRGFIAYKYDVILVL